MDEPLPGDIESHLSLLIMSASARLAGKHEKEAKAAQAAETAADPLIQIEQARLQNEAQRVADKKEEVTLHIVNFKPAGKDYSFIQSEVWA